MLIQLKTWESALGIYPVFKKTPLHSYAGSGGFKLLFTNSHRVLF